MSNAKRVGIYLRVSTDDQTTENQRLELERIATARGWQVIETYVDHGISGYKGRDKRPALDQMLKDASRGKINLIAAWSLDRLGRSVQHLVNMFAELAEQGVGVYLNQQAIDTSTPAGKAMIQMCAVFAEFERGMIVDRVRAGMQRARAEGKHLGRPSITSARTRPQILRLHAEGRKGREIARDLKISEATVRRVLASQAA